MEVKEDPQTPVETEPPLSDQLLDLLQSISIPFYAIRLIQICTLCVVVFIYFLFVLVAVAWPRYDHTLVSTQCGQHNARMSVDLTHWQELPNGSRVRGDITYPEKAMWTYKSYKRGCSCYVKTCVRKCCPRDERLLSPNDLTCTDNNSTSVFKQLNGLVYPKPRKEVMLEILRPKEIDPSDYHVVSGFADCYKYLGMFGARYEIQEVETRLMEDGTVLTADMMYLDIDDYCMDQTTVSDDVLTLRCVSVTLLHEAKSWMTRKRSRSEWTALIVSVVSLVVTLALYIYVPQQRTLHGKLLMGYLSFLTINYLQFVIAGFHHRIRLPYIMEYLWQFGFISCFCWLTALCFDVWLLFSGSFRPRSEHQEKVKFHRYSMFSWGCPAILCALTWVVGVVPYRSDSCHKPRFEDDSCIFTMERTTRLFYNAPVVVLAILNVVLYVSTVFNKMSHFKTNIKAFGDSPCNRPTELARQGFRLYTKMAKVAVFSGVCLLLLTTPYYKQCTFFSHHLTLLYYCQGLIIFVLLCCNVRTAKYVVMRNLELKQTKAKPQDEINTSTSML